ncbi:MAG: YncE family protein [Caldilineaceae bacterium]
MNHALTEENPNDIVYTSEMAASSAIPGCGLLFCLVLAAISACRGQATREDRLPQLQAVIRVPGASAMAMAPNGLVYVVNLGGEPGKSYIAVLDGPKQVDTIPWPDESSWGAGAEIAYNPHNHLLYILDRIIYQLYVIRDTEVVTTMKVGYAPWTMVIHPTSGHVYIPNIRTAPLDPGQDPGPGEVVVVEDTQILRRIPLEDPLTVTVSDFDNQVYIGQANPFGKGAQHILVAIDDSTFITQTIYEADYGGGINEIDIDRSNGHLYVTRDDFGLLVYWDGTDFQRIDVGSLGYSINTIAMDSQKHRLYAASWDGPPSHVIVIEGATVVAEIPVGNDVRGLAIDHTHDYVYATNYRSDTLSIIRGTEVITTVETGGLGPFEITVDEKRGYIYVSNSNSASVAVFGFEEGNAALDWRQFLPFIEK